MDGVTQMEREAKQSDDETHALLHQKGQEVYANIFLPAAHKATVAEYSPGQTIYGCLRAAAHFYRHITPGTPDERIKMFSDIASQVMQEIEEVTLPRH